MITRRALAFTATATPFLSFAGDVWADTPKDTIVVGKIMDETTKAIYDQFKDSRPKD